MDFDNVINKRRSARSFKRKLVSNDMLYKIIKSASIAPSAKNRQPWKFYILNSSQKTEIANMLLDWTLKNKNSHTSVKGTAFEILEADKMIMVYKETYKSKNKTEYYYKPDLLSLGCALENMSLEAVNLGLGSCILCDTLYIEKEINNYLSINDFEQICGFIIGYPIFNYPSKSKKNIDNILLNKTNR